MLGALEDAELLAQQHNLQVFFMVRQTPDADQINHRRKQPEKPKPDHGAAPCHDNEGLIVPDWGIVPGQASRLDEVFGHYALLGFRDSARTCQPSFNSASNSASLASS